MNLRDLTDAELIQDLAECVSLEGEAKARAKPIKDELLRRQVEDGVKAQSHNGWRSTLIEEKPSVAWLERRYGFTRKELPGDLFTEKVTLELDVEKLAPWLAEQGMEMDVSYTLRFEREKVKA